MTREQREQFVREQIFAYGTWEEAVQRIVDRWESDADDAYTRGFYAGQDAERSVG